MADDFVPDAPTAGDFTPDAAPAPPVGAAPSPPPATAPLSWSDVGSQALSNTPSSAYGVAHALVQPVLHPVETVENLKNLGMGVLEKTGVVPGEDHVKYADAVGHFLADRYGGYENVKRTLANDPVGIAADVSMLLTGGETALGRMPGIVGRAAEVAGETGRAINPINMATKGVEAAGRGVGNVAAQAVGNLGTFTGAEPLKYAFRAGYEGGQSAADFQGNLRGAAPMSAAVDEARNAVRAMRDQRGVAYKTGMQQIAGNPTVLDFQKIDNAYNSVANVKNFKGQDLSPATAGIRSDLKDAIDNWRALPPQDFHTVEGFDALKQKIGDIRDGTDYGTPARTMANSVYNAVRQTIVNADPRYARVMKGYEDASGQISNIERELSLNPTANVDTALRKLQSSLRDNVNTSFGRRKVLAEYLVNAGAPNLMYKLSGQALQPWFSRGIGRLGTQLAAELAAFHFVSPGIAAAAPLMSPRLMGEAAYYTGRATSPLKYAPDLRNAAFARPFGELPAGQPFPLQGMVPARAEDNEPNVPGIGGQQKHGGAVGQQRATGGKVGDSGHKGPLNRRKGQPARPLGAKLARDGKFYLPDKARPGKYLMVVPRV